MKKTILGGLILTILAVCAYGGWYGYRQQNLFTVVFPDANGLLPEAGVWMAGLEIGKVQEIRIASDGVEVFLFIKPDNRKQLTDKALFVIDPGLGDSPLPVVRVKAGARGGRALQRDTRLRGMSSIVLWQVADFPEKIQELMNEPQLKESIRRLDELGQELQK